MSLWLEEELLQAVKESNATTVANLLAAGADPNAGLFRREHVLSMAVCNGSEEILDLLLKRGPIVCMKESHSDNQRSPTIWHKLRWLASALKGTVVRTGIALLAPLAMHKLAMSLSPGFLQNVGLYGSRYFWFLMHASRASLLSDADLRTRYLDWWTYTDTLSHRLKERFVRRLFRIPLPILSPSYVQSFAMPLLLRFCIDVIVVAGRSILHVVRTDDPERQRWTGNLPLSNYDGWLSPAEKVLRAVLESESVTEAMVLKLLQADTLASQPYERSEAARTLLGLAVRKCWPRLTRYLVNAGVPVDRGLSSHSYDLRWPALTEALVYVFRPQDLFIVPRTYFHGKRVLWSTDTSLRHGRVSTFAQLRRPVNTRNQAVSGSTNDVSEAASLMEMMDILRDCGADPLLTDSQGNDFLIYVIQQRWPTDAVRHLLQILKDDPDWSPGTASPVLYEAVCRQSPNLETIRLLLEAGISPESENRDEKTPLHAAAYMNDSTDALELLLDYGADPDNGGKCGLPPILRTLDDCSHEKFVCFLRNGADPNATNAEGKTVLQVVMEEASPRAFRGRLVKSLLECDSLVVFDIETQTSPAFLAAVSQPNSAGWDEKILDLLLERIPTYERQRLLNSALQIASGRNSWEHCNIFTVFYLLRVGADPVSVANGCDTLLHRICAARRLEDHEHREDMRELLSRQNLDVNASGNDKKVPLHHAVEMGNRDLVYLLLEHKADPNVKDVKGQTPLQLLCSSKSEEYTISHSQSDVQDDANDAQYCGVRGQASWRFVTRERRWNIKRSLEQEEMFQVLVEHGADITVADNRGRTLLMMACEQGNSVIAANILYLYSLGIKWLAEIFDEAECTGVTIFPFAYSNVLQRPGMERLADAVNWTDCSGKTALHFAAANGDIYTLKTLLNPQQIFRPRSNVWRSLAEAGEIHENKTMNQNLESPTEQHMIEQEIEYRRSLLGVPSFLRKHYIYMDEPKEDKLTIGGPRRGEIQNIYLPNVSVSEWELDTDEGKTLVRLEEQVDCRGRTPLHYAAEGEHLEAVKLLLKYDGIDVQARDNSGRRAIDLALDNNFYDVLNVLQD
ncbi:uncharacterized protein CDV56_102257 [Aspergillus thermomutatus]|uniref:Uncharacterized protein n=1 Tax=Aspergillus thermomutatus TaxID=41047 RepID=A0A397GRN9_ASPTH|nr:uncharacterized protein CDV56_102257 [Aspergillus thermomutatus]RHZ53721.1 hypothetical protein CDV56_102257 [Aspergillus thermomutatus]